jgi:hypothetical protein
MMRRAKVNFLDKEDMMGHKVGLERHYERYQEEDFERFPEYQKAIPFLTISNEELLRLENQQKQEEINQLETKSHEIDDLRKRIEELEYGPEKRNLVFLKGINNPDMSTVEKILRPLVHLIIEKKYSEEEKREMFKRMSEAKKTGKALKLAELLPSKF